MILILSGVSIKSQSQCFLTDNAKPKQFVDMRFLDKLEKSACSTIYISRMAILNAPAVCEANGSIRTVGSKRSNRSIR
jgi:hypothetical protein